MAADADANFCGADAINAYVLAQEEDPGAAIYCGNDPQGSSTCWVGQ